MSLTLINVGTVPNDHTGDPFRTAFQKTNSIITQLNTGGLYMGPLSNVVGITIDEGGSGQNTSPGLLIKGSVGARASISLAANGATPTVNSVDFIQNPTGDFFITINGPNAFTLSTSDVARFVVDQFGATTSRSPTADVLAFQILGTTAGGATHGTLKVQSPVNPRISSFDCLAANGGWTAWQRSSNDKAFFGDSNALIGGQIDDYTLRSNAGLAMTAPTARIAIATNSNTGAIAFLTSPTTSLLTRAGINSAGNFNIYTPDSGFPLQINLGSLWSATNPGIVINGDGGAGCGISICANGASPNGQSFDIYQDNAGNTTIASRANATLTFLTNNSTALSLAANHNATFTGQIGVNSNAPPAQVTGWGTPVGNAIINNYNITDAGGANSNTNKALAQIIHDLKAIGFYGT